MPIKDKGKRKEYNKKYWRLYYERNKERILRKNRDWYKRKEV